MLKKEYLKANREERRINQNEKQKQQEDEAIVNQKGLQLPKVFGNEASKQNKKQRKEIDWPTVIK